MGIWTRVKSTWKLQRLKSTWISRRVKFAWISRRVKSTWAYEGELNPHGHIEEIKLKSIWPY